MGDDYWNSSSVNNVAKQQRIFDTDGNNSIDRFKTHSDPLIESIISSSRATPSSNTSGASSARYRGPTTNDPPMTQPKTTTILSAPVTRPVNPPVASARFNRSPVPSSNNDTHSNAHWQPHAEDYPDQTVKDRSTQYDREMEIRCKSLLEGKNFKLDDIRDYDQKASLLRMTMALNTPSVTVPVMLFLENSLSRPLFYELIKQHPSAVKNYMNTAKLRLENDYYIAMLKQFERNEDVAMIRIRQASQTSDMNTKLTILDQAASELGAHPWWHLQIAEQRHLLNKQRELQTSLASSSMNTRLENRTTLETYKFVYEMDFRRQKQNRNLDKSTVDRSKEFEMALHMSPEMTMCGKLTVIMHCGLHAHYDDFVHQAIHQGLFGKKYIIGPEYLADMVHNWVQYSGEGQEKASEKTGRFLNMIVDPVKRIYFAEKCQNFDVAIDTIVNTLRDRAELENLRKRMPNNHPAFNRATSVLDNTKWRN